MKMTSDSTFQLREKLPSEFKQVSPFVDRIFKELSQRSLKEDLNFKIKLALEEALTNAMRHGNSLKASRKVDVCVTMDSQTILLEVHDEGRGFNAKSVPDPTKKGYAENIPGGRGIFLMQQLMDHVEFYDGGRGVRMLKQLL